jgi:hypothetical protein
VIHWIFKATIGICSQNIKDKDKLVVIPKDPDEFKNNELVLIISAQDFIKFSEESNGVIKFINSIKDMEINKK